MAGGKTFYLSKKYLEHTLGRTIFTPPATLYVALSAQPFTPEPILNQNINFYEPPGNGYARVAVTNDASSFTLTSTSTPAVKANNVDFQFPTATGSWGTPASAYLFDASTDGNALYGCDIQSASEIQANGSFKIAAGTMIFTED